MLRSIVLHLLDALVYLLCPHKDSRNVKIFCKTKME